jgi:hemicentin
MSKPSFPVPPSIDAEKSSPRQQNIIINGSTSLTCHVSGLPTPTVTWLVNGFPLELSGMSSRLTVSAEGHQLNIDRATVDDTTRYSCIASNEAGVADRDFDLAVLGKE